MNRTAGKAKKKTAKPSTKSKAAKTRAVMVPRGKTISVSQAVLKGIRDRIKAHMAKNGFTTQSAFARHVGLTYSRMNTLFLLRTGTLAESEISKLTTELGVSEEVLLRGVSGALARRKEPQIIDLSRLANDGTGNEDEEEEAINLEIATGNIRLRIEVRA